MAKRVVKEKPKHVCRECKHSYDWHCKAVEEGRDDIAKADSVHFLISFDCVAMFLGKHLRK